ncbi:hypothetical protein Gohar_007810, partial [Gossypium harknessii]|nr:hypothetical protein [Gossypium harknessii]
MLRPCFDGEVLEFIAVCPPPNDELGTNKCLWKSSVSGRFSVAPFVDCGDFRESVLHILRDCPIATGVWLNLIPSSCSYQFFGMELTEWVLAILRNKFALNSRTVDWGVMFA